MVFSLRPAWHSRQEDDWSIDGIGGNTNHIELDYEEEGQVYKAQRLDKGERNDLKNWVRNVTDSFCKIVKVILNTK